MDKTEKLMTIAEKAMEAVKTIAEEEEKMENIVLFYEHQVNDLKRKLNFAVGPEFPNRKEGVSRGDRKEGVTARKGFPNRKEDLGPEHKTVGPEHKTTIPDQTEEMSESETECSEVF